LAGFSRGAGGGEFGDGGDGETAGGEEAQGVFAARGVEFGGEGLAGTVTGAVGKAGHGRNFRFSIFD